MRTLTGTARATVAGVVLAGAAAVSCAPAATAATGTLPDYRFAVTQYGTFTASYCLVAADPADGHEVGRSCAGPARPGERVEMRIPRQDVWWRMSVDIDVEGAEPVRGIVVSAGYNEALDDHVNQAHTCITVGDGVHLSLRCYYDEQMETFYER